MTPPQLAGDAPVVNVAHPLEVSLRILLRRELDVPLLDGRNCLICQRLNLDKPLRRETRFDHRLAAVAFADGVHVLLHRNQQVLCLQILEHFLARHVAIHPRVCAGRHVQMRRLVHDVDGRQVHVVRRLQSRWDRALESP